MNVTSALSRLSQLVVLGLILTGSHAFGQIETQTQTFTGVNGTSGAITLDFNSFNSSLGTLNSVTVELIGVALSGNAQATNTNGAGNNSEDIEVNLIGQIKVTSVSNPEMSPISLNVEDTVGNEDTNVSATPSPPAPIISPTQNNNQTPVYTYVNAPVNNPSGTTSPATAGYVGSGSPTITLTVTPHGVGVTGIATNNGSDPTANASFSGLASVSGTLVLIYNYTPAVVPEPSKTAAIFIGFALCLLVGRNYFKARGLRLS